MGRKCEVKHEKIDSSGITTEVLNEVTEICSRIQGVNEVILTETHSKPVEFNKELKDKKQLVIHLWSVPPKVKTEHESLYEKGMHLIKSRKVNLTPWQGDVYLVKDMPKAYTLVNDAKKNGIAIYRDNNIWILFDIADSRESKLPEIEDVLRYILEQCGFSIREWDIADEKDHLQKLYEIFLKRRVDDLKARKDNSFKQMESAERNFLQRLNTFISEDRMIGLTLDKLDDMKTSTEEMWDRIVKVKEIKKINLVNLDELECLTNDIFLGPFNIGTFKIILSNKGLRIFSNTIKSGHQHPHISEKGVPCLGNAGDLMKHFYSGEWDVTLLTLIKFLKSYNGASPHVRLSEYLGRISKEEQNKFKETTLEKNIRRIMSNGKVIYE